MMLDLVTRNRSYRRFYQHESIDAGTLRELVNLARLSPSGANLQPLKFIISSDNEKNALIFEHLAWAGYLSDWDGPVEGERPAGYIIILGDKQIKESVSCDHGIAAQSILLGAVEKGLGGCIFGSIQRKKLRQSLNIPEQYEILIIIALGVPKEEMKIESVEPDGDIKYWRDSDGVHHVPKRSMDDIIVDI